MFCRLLPLVTFVLAISAGGCGGATSWSAPPSSDKARRAPTPEGSAIEPSKSTDARPKPPARPAPRAREEFKFSKPTPKATFGMPLVIDFPDLPEVPKEIKGPSPPITKDQ